MKKYLAICLALLLSASLAVTLLTCGGGGGSTETISPGLSISGPTEVNENESGVYIATMTWGDGTKEIVTCGWAVSPTTYASISSNGILNASPVTENQTCYVAAAYMDGGETYNATMEVTIIDVPDNALLLDGVDDRAEANTSIFPNTSTLRSFTVEAWIYPSRTGGMFIATDDAYDLLLSYRDDAANNGVGITFTLWGGDCAHMNSRTEYRGITLNQWNHVAAIFDASAKSFSISVNGILSSSPTSFTGSTFCSVANQQFTVGGFYGEDGYLPFQGEIDDVMVSSSVRYNSDFFPTFPLAPDANTQGLWHFDEPVGSTTFSDSSGNGYTLTGLNGARTY